jgi:hypothetical protein
VARAAHSDGVVVLELLDPIEGATAVVQRVVDWWGEFRLEAVGVDPRSPSATVVEPLELAGMPVHLASAVDLAKAHGMLLDRLSDGSVRIAGHGAEDAAARQAMERRLAGSTGVDRYASSTAPLLAVELALWALPAEAFDPSVYVI